MNLTQYCHSILYLIPRKDLSLTGSTLHFEYHHFAQTLFSISIPYYRRGNRSILANGLFPVFKWCLKSNNHWREGLLLSYTLEIPRVLKMYTCMSSKSNFGLLLSAQCLIIKKIIKSLQCLVLPSYVSKVITCISQIPSFIREITMLWKWEFQRHKELQKSS